jgi:hypothetical protein
MSEGAHSRSKLARPGERRPQFDATLSAPFTCLLARGLLLGCAVSAQNKMNFGFTPLSTADTTVLFLTSRKPQKS